MPRIALQFVVYERLLWLLMHATQHVFDQCSLYVALRSEDFSPPTYMLHHLHAA